jgi:enamine deaminase RidA (YjgF/YER057c/UK114 family)
MRLTGRAAALFVAQATNMRFFVTLNPPAMLSAIACVALSFWLAACSGPVRPAPLRAINPPTVYSTQAGGYVQAIRVGPGALLFVSGLVGWDVERRLTGSGDLADQTRQALRNVAAALAASGASPEDLIQLRIYIAGVDPAARTILKSALDEFFGSSGARPTSTLLYVSALARPELLVEIEAVARIP